MSATTMFRSFLRISLKQRPGTLRYHRLASSFTNHSHRSPTTKNLTYHMQSRNFTVSANHCNFGEANFTTKTIEVKSKTKLKPEGTTFCMTFADSSSSETSDTERVIVGLHGSPGTMTDLLPLLAPLVDQGYRVIVPDLPGFGQSMRLGEEGAIDQHYSQRVVERANVVRNFMQALGINRSLSLLVTHCSGAYLATYLVAHQPDVTRGLMLITPGLIYRTPITLFPPWLVKVLLDAWDNNPALKRAIEMLGELYFRIMKIPQKSVYDMKRSARVVTEIDFKRMRAYASQIGAGPLPLTYVFCDGDPVLSTADSRENARYYSIPPGHTDEYDKQAQLTTQGAVQLHTNYRKGVMFTRRTHFPPKHEDLRAIIQQEMYTLLEVAERQAEDTPES